MNAVATIRGLRKTLGGRAVLAGVDLELPAGTTTVLLGANGVGKSTLVRHLLGLERADAGSIRVAGFDPYRAAREVRQRVGYVPAQPDGYDWMSPRELFSFLAPQYPRWSPTLEGRLCARLDVPLDTPFASLSRGEAAKASFVAALAPQPELYLVDEGFSGLDPLVRDQVLSAFLAEVELAERAALVVTHELDVAARLADRVAVLEAGRISACVDVQEWIEEAGGGSLPQRLRGLLGAAEREGSVSA